MYYENQDLLYGAIKKTHKVNYIGKALTKLETMICAYISQQDNPAELDMLSIIRAIPDYTRRVMYRVIDEQSRIFHNKFDTSISYGEDLVRKTYQRLLKNFDINKYDKNTHNKNSANFFDGAGPTGAMYKLTFSNPNDDINPTSYITDGEIPQSISQSKYFKAYAKVEPRQLELAICSQAKFTLKNMIELAKANIEELNNYENAITAHNQMTKALKSCIINHITCSESCCESSEHESM